MFEYICMFYKVHLYLYLLIRYSTTINMKYRKEEQCFFLVVITNTNTNDLTIV